MLLYNVETFEAVIRDNIENKLDKIAAKFLNEQQTFGNVFRNLQKSSHTFTGYFDTNNRGYRSFFKLNNGISIHNKSWIFSISLVGRSRGGVKNLL